MKHSWQFAELSPQHKSREAMQGEFFSAEGLEGAADALVRESIQNSLDAVSPGQVLSVVIRVPGKGGAVSATRMSSLTHDLWQHLRAVDEMPEDTPGPKSECCYISIEDFGTSGLEGDEKEWRPVGHLNAFYHFFRAEGRSQKTEGARGRWGIGKFVFPRSSRVRSFLALTVRRSDQRAMLLGQSILRTHMIGNTPYTPDGWFGEKSENGAYLPHEDAALIEEVSSAFKLRRRAEPGLSVIVPYCDPSIDAAAIIRAVLRDYFVPILRGRLSVRVLGEIEDTLIDADALPAVLSSLEESQTDLRAMIELAAWARDLRSGPHATLSLPSSTHSIKWANDALSEESRLLLAKRYSAGERMAIRVPLTVRPKRGESRDSHFDVYLGRDSSASSSRPVFVRDGIVISDARAPRERGLRALVLIEDAPLSGLLGDAENPAHTQWQADSSNFKGKYTYAPSYLTFVMTSVRELVRMLSAAEDQENRELLADYFSVSIPEDESTGRTRRPATTKTARDSTPAIQPPPPRVRRYRLSRIDSGFTVTSGDKEARALDILDIQVAYDVRSGNPLKRYSPEDFRLDRRPIAVDFDETAIEEITRADNRMLVRVVKPDFSLTVCGFDANRDLYVRVTPKETRDDSEV